MSDPIHFDYRDFPGPHGEQTEPAAGYGPEEYPAHAADEPMLRTMAEIVGSADPFGHAYRLLRGDWPMPWHRQLFLAVGAGKPPPEIPINDALDVEGIIPLWLIARTLRPDAVPTRIVWTYPRGVVVDAATDVAVRMLDHLPLDAPEMRFAVRSIRGPHGGLPWKTIMPHESAVIIGTTEEIGGALAFRGGRWERSIEDKPHAAGLLGVDAWHVLAAGYRQETAYRHWMDGVIREQAAEVARGTAPLRPLWWTVVTSI